jgi:hypothetical protein
MFILGVFLHQLIFRVPSVTFRVPCSMFPVALERHPPHRALYRRQLGLQLPFQVPYNLNGPTYPTYLFRMALFLQAC